MFSFELIIAIRNILLVQLVMLAIIPGHAVLVRQELNRIRKLINRPQLLKKESPDKKDKFWEIDMTKFEP